MMQTLKTLIILVLCLLTTFLHAQRLTFTPEKPVAGETVTVTYDQAASPFKGDEKLKVIAFAIDADKLTNLQMESMEKNGKRSGKIVVPASAKAIYFVLRSLRSEEEDNNNGKGYGTPVYQADRKTPVNGYELTRAAIVAEHFSALQLERNEPEALKLLNAQFNAVKSNQSLLTTYAYIANRNKQTKAITSLKGFASETINNIKSTEDQLETVLVLAEALEDEDLMTAATKKMKKRFPKGKVIWYEKSKSFFNGGMTPTQQKAVVDALLTFPKTKAMERDFTSMAYSVASTSLRQEDIVSFEKYAKLVSDRTVRASLYNSYAWTEAGEGLEKPAGNLELAKKLSWESLKLLEAAMNAPTEEETYTGYSAAEMKEIIKRNYVLFCDTYALILYRTGQEVEALKYQQLACEEKKFQDPEMNERYCLYLEKVQGAAKTIPVIEDLINKDVVSPAIKAQFKRLFAATYSLQEATDKYVVLLEKEGKAKMKEELKKKIINEEAPTFTLSNLAGETVSLESLKGKIVVLDFWATWCRPCVSSFPGMQRAQDAHAQQNDVVFLFVNCGEKKTNVSNFITNSKYTFNVLLDNDNITAGAYNISVIPTKVILDRNGRIRFKSTGYGGDPDALVDEMAFMIELAGQ